MMFIKSNNRGFAMLEVMLAGVIITVISFGVYALYARSQQTVAFNQVKQQIIALSTTFSTLADAHVTQSMPDGLEAFFYNSNQLPQQYFHISDDKKTITLVNPHGALSFTDVSASGFSATIPVGSANQAQYLCDQVQPTYVSDCQPSTNPNAPATIIVTVNTSGN